MKKQIILATLVLSAGIGLLGVTNVRAQETDSQTTLVQRIAQKFNVKQEDVQSVFDAHRQEMQVQMQERLEERLAQAVKDGKITEAQKALILEKHKELQANRESKMEEMKNMTPEQRRAAKEAHKQTLDDWAEQNGIDPQYVMGGFGKMGHGRMMK